jgi:hypothetical protein
MLKEKLLIQKTKNQARDQGIIHFKDSIWFKSIQISS